ncbi:MAG: alanine--tRNA ligase [Lachnospiraceae bacterium]|nr:alanine--tRNA ligase [Lachnospiraceae bacterium]
MKYGVNELRKMYLDFFQSKGHLVMKSFSLVPHNDNSLLLINAGMAPLKPYFTGQEIPPRRRVTTCQKCVRTGDIENVGKTERHLTFFEMLGNFSFGDYFKTEAIHWSWEFLTEVLKLDPERLYVTIYIDDDEAYKIWHEEMNVPSDHIMRIGRSADGSSDNFWEHGAGPCGPCTEMHYDRGEKYGTGPEDVLGGEGDRFMEIWNNVFTQFEGDGHGNYTELSQKNIDTGMGLERLAVVMQDVESVFDIDTMVAIRDAICKLAGKKYKENEKDDISIRLITDHIRSATFMISDGITPSNEGRGYVLRRLIRRAARHGRMLGIKGAFLGKIADVVIESSKAGYPELVEKASMIKKVLTKEEEQFNKTIDNGLELLTKYEDALKEEGKTELSGEDAFRLYDTYGFPVDLTAEILEEQGLTYDKKGFEDCMERQREQARNARHETNYMGTDASVYEEIDPKITSAFVGYDENLDHDSKISVLTSETEIVDSLTEGQKGTIIVDETPFYGTMGGQNGDQGYIRNEDGEFKVEDTIHLLGGKIGHVGVVTRGSLMTGSEVHLSVDKKRRDLISRNHTATHLLQAALRRVLGDHVQQAGSDNNTDRLRFDFTHFSAMTKDELKQVETLVNEEIRKSLPVVTEVMSLEEAKKTGAMALFGEKYGDKVRVVKVDDFSTELCGGTHVANTGEIGAFKILSESGVSSGVRRIEAVTSDGLISYYEGREALLDKAAEEAKVTAAELPDRIVKMQEELKALKSENESLKSKAAQAAAGDVMDQVEEVKGVKLLAVNVPGVGGKELRDLGDSFKEKLGSGVVVIASEADGKVGLIAMATDDAIAKGAHAGNLIKAISGLVGGGGGGRPNMAQAGGKNPAGIEDALKKAKETLAEQLG